ncbi:glutamine amidotransferase-related protein, partial [Stenotrophomonas sp. NPDC077659]
MLWMIDNYDSFTYNLVQYLQTLGAEVRVVRPASRRQRSVGPVQGASC